MVSFPFKRFYEKGDEIIVPKDSNSAFTGKEKLRNTAAKKDFLIFIWEYNCNNILDAIFVYFLLNFLLV